MSSPIQQDPQARRIPTTEDLLAYINSLQAQLNSVQQAQASSTQTPTASVKTKVPTPQPFYGKRYQVKPFISGLNIYINLRSQEFPDERAKILFAASLLKGTAFDWFRPYEDFVSSGTISNSSLAINTFQDFCEQLSGTFGDPDEGLTAATKIYKLTQTRSVADYVSEFQRLSSQLTWNEDALRDLFFQGLKPAIQNTIIRGIMPTSLKDMIRVANNLDSRLMQHRPHNTPWQPSRHSARSSQNPDAMELDALSYSTKANPAPASSSPRGPLTQEEKQHRMDNNLCLYCGKAGHSVKECFSAKKHRGGSQSKNSQA
jgi:Ty3 transposon capsid-like protein